VSFKVTVNGEEVTGPKKWLFGALALLVAIPILLLVPLLLGVALVIVAAAMVLAALASVFALGKKKRGEKEKKKDNTP